MKLLVGVLWTVAAVLVVVVLARLLGVERRSAPALVMGLLPWVLLPAYPLLVTAALLHHRALAAVAAAVVAAHVVFVAPAFGASSRPCEGAPLRIVAFNVLKANDQAEAAGRQLRALRPDVLVVPELTRRIERQLRDSGVLDDLPYPAVRTLRNTDTVAIYSRLPVSDVEILMVPGQQWPQATVVVGGTPVRITGVHTSAPRTGRLSREWADSQAELDRYLQDSGTAAVAAGDFNADRGHASFRALLHGGVRDAHEERGRGLVRTWPAAHPFLHLDHVLVRDGAGAGIAVCGIREVRLPGSDHLALVVDLAVRPAVPAPAATPGTTATPSRP